MSKNNFTFEQLCIRNEKGFAFDLGTMFLPSNPNSFDDVVFKLISKIDTSLLLLKTHDVQVETFTVIAIPLSSPEIPDQNHGDAKTYSGRKSKIQASKSPILNLSTLQNAWEYLAGEGWHGLHSLALLGPDSIPDIGSRQYSLYQYTTCIMDVIRANYMFQKFKSSFHHETLEMFDEADINGATQAVFGLLWKKSPPSLNRKFPNVASWKRKSSVPVPELDITPPKRIVTPAVQLSPRSPRRQIQKENAHRYVTFDNEEDEDEDEEEEEEEEAEEEDGMEVDEEISFRNPILRSLPERPLLIIDDKPLIPTSPKGRKKASPTRGEPSSIIPTYQSLPTVADITLGFETSASVSKGSRKSMGRKSLSSDWPEEERQNILDVYDNLNPNVSEQKRIALTCKYVSFLMEKELPSKLLYQWIQKKGRVINKTATTFITPEGEQQKEVALKCLRELNENCSETARIAFTLKYLDVQYGLSINSKQLYTWLNEKPSVKRPTRRR